MPAIEVMNLTELTARYAFDGDLELGGRQQVMAVAGQFEQSGGQADEGEEQADGQEYPGQRGRPFRVAVAGQVGEREEIAGIGVGEQAT